MERRSAKRSRIGGHNATVDLYSARGRFTLAKLYIAKYRKSSEEWTVDAPSAGLGTADAARSLQAIRPLSGEGVCVDARAALAPGAAGRPHPVSRVGTT